MLAKLTSKNQITIPKAVMKQIDVPEYFSVKVTDGSIVLTPMRESRIHDVWAHIEALNLTEQDIEDAIAWARQEQ